MNELANLSALSLELPSPAYLVGSVLFGIVGYLAFRRGRKEAKPELTWSGVALIVHPYAISQTWLLWLVGATLCGWLYVKRD